MEARDLESVGTALFGDDKVLMDNARLNRDVVAAMLNKKRVQECRERAKQAKIHKAEVQSVRREGIATGLRAATRAETADDLE